MSDFKELQATYPQDKDYPARMFTIASLTRVIDGTLYDELEYPFSMEKNGAGEYNPLNKRRPSAKTRLCRTVVNDSVSLLFSEGHFPKVNCADDKSLLSLQTIIKEAKLNQVMIDAATRGSVGSVCVLMRILRNRVFFAVMDSTYLTPTFDPEAPDTLLNVTERYKASGANLKAVGFVVADADLTKQFWFQRVFDANQEKWFEPLSLEDAQKGVEPKVNAKLTTTHALGFVPAVWIKNLPSNDPVDGEPTFSTDAVDVQIETDYLLSQGGRGLKYQSDPTLHIKEPAFGGNSAIVKGAANAIITSTEGDAKLLEINGSAAGAVMEWVQGLRELALEGMGGNKSSNDKIASAQSGRAMELMNQTLIWLADKLRISYGEGALIDLLSMIAKASIKYSLVDKKGNALGKLNDADLSLSWPKWYAPTFADSQTQAITLDVLRQSGLISQETAVKTIAPSYDIENVEEEIAKVEPPPNLPPKPQSEPLSNSDD